MDKVNQKLIGKRIKMARKRLHISQMQLAELSDLSNVYISNIENGKKMISLNSLIRIANALRVSCDELLYGNQISDISDTYTEIKNFSNEERCMLVEILEKTKEIIADYRILEGRNNSSSFNWR